MNQVLIIIILSIAVSGFGFNEVFAEKHDIVLDDVCLRLNTLNDSSGCTSYDVEKIIPDKYHIGIVIDGVCDRLNTLNDSSGCPNYDDVEKIFPDTKIKSHLLPNIEAYDRGQKIQFNSQVKILKDDCITYDICTFFDIKEDQEIIIWHNPEATLHELIDTVTVRNEMKIDAIYNVAQKVIRESDIILKESYENQVIVNDEFDNNLERLIELEEKEKEQRELSDEGEKRIVLLEKLLGDEKIWASFEGADPEFKEVQAAKIKALEGELENLMDQQIRIDKDHADSINEISMISNSNLELGKELDEITAEIITTESKVRPETKIGDDESKRNIVFNVNQLYVDQDCKDSFFKFNDFEIELQALVDYMFSNCSNNELLYPFELTHTEVFPKHELDITTSPNWQYEQLLKTIIENCKKKC